MALVSAASGLGLGKVFSAASINQAETGNMIGYWSTDQEGLPCFRYTGLLPFKAVLKNGQKVNLPSDPWFLLGNYRFNLFTHVSGLYEIITGERAFARMNMGDVPNSGKNFARVEILSSAAKKIKLTGEDGIGADPAVCTRTFGCGFAAYHYQLDTISVDRTLSVLPSEKINEGVSAFLLTVTIQNKTKEPIKLRYTEGVDVKYEMIGNQYIGEKDKKVRYEHQCVQDGQDLLRVDIFGKTDDPLLITSDKQSSPIDAYPPSLFLQSLSNNPGHTLAYNAFGKKSVQLSSISNISLKPNGETTFQLVIGYSFLNQDNNHIRSMSKSLADGYLRTQNPFAAKWKEALPVFANEKDKELENEMVWHAYTLEALANYNEFYGETKLHQGTIYVFGWGIIASARDDFEHALPLCYYNPELVKSTLRYMRKRTTAWGEIRLIESGYGVADAQVFNTSDQPLWYFMLLTEFLRITKDFDFLLEKTECYPIKDMPQYNGIETMVQCFSFLKDYVGIGSHGLVRLLNSDWNDGVYFDIDKVNPYMRIVSSGESHMNTTMALSIFSQLLPLLETMQNDTRFARFHDRLSELHQSVSLYRNNLYAAFEKDLGDRTFSRRMYFDWKAWGDENMYLEPQGFMLQIPELSNEKKHTLYQEMKKRLYQGEKLGAREQQSPEFDRPIKGSRDNGGFWYAINGPVIIGMAALDKEEAHKLLKKMSFTNYAKEFPDYWTSYWSAADNVDTSLLPTEGLCDLTGIWWEQPVYCTHPHAWLLYCYYYLNNVNS
jgi:hypothetical protein